MANKAIRPPTCIGPIAEAIKTAEVEETPLFSNKGRI